MEITDREKEAIKAYQGNGYRLINNILEVDMSAESEFIRNSTDRPVTFDEESIKKMIEDVKDIYLAMLKFSANRDASLNRVYRGTSKGDMDRLGNRGSINKFLSTTYDKDQAEGYFSLNWDYPAFVGIDVARDVPYLYMSSVLDDYGENAEREILLSPFLRVKNLAHVRDDRRTSISGIKVQEIYRMELESQDLEELADEEKSALSSDIFERAEEISKKQERYFKIEKEIDDTRYFIRQNDERIEKLRLDMQNPGSERERLDILDNLTYFSGERKQELESKYSKLLDERAELKTEIEGWKKEVAKVCMSECRTVEKEFQQQLSNERMAAEKRAEQERLSAKRREVKDIQNLHESACISVKNRVGTVDMDVKKLLAFKELISSAGQKMGISYTSYIDVLHNIPQCVNVLNDKLNSFSDVQVDVNLETEEDMDREIIDKAQIKSASERLLRLSKTMDNIPTDKLKKLEENAFKQGISNKVFDARLNIYTKLLRDEISQIDNIKGIKKLLYKVTGKEKKNNLRKVELEQTIRQIFEKKREIMVADGLNREYSVHEIAAEIAVLQNEYGSDPSLRQEIYSLGAIREELNKFYKLNQSKINGIANGMLQNRLPMVDGKEYKRTDLIMRQVHNFEHNDGRNQQTRGYRFNVQNSIQEMANVIRDTLETDRRLRAKSMEISR